MRTSVSETRAGRSQNTSHSAKSKTGSNTTRRSVNPPPSRPSFAVTDSQHIPTHRPSRASIPGRLNGGKQPQVATPSERSEGVQRRQDKPAPLAQTRQKPQTEPVEAHQKRPQVQHKPQVEKRARVPRVAPAPARQEPMREEESIPDEVDPLDIELAELQGQVGSLLAFIDEVGDDTTRLEGENLDLIVQQLESVQTGLQSAERQMSRRRRLFGPALEILRRETEPQPNPAKKVEMKEHVVSQTECWDHNKCAICLSEFRYHEKGVFSLKCGHLVHGGCVDKWFEAHHTCPVCRTDVDEG